MLYTKDMQETVDFYVNVLGFSSNAYEPGWGWASLQLDKTEIMLAIPPSEVPFDKPVFTGSLYFKTDNVDQLWEKLKDKTNNFYGIENFDYGMREFAIYDNNGYLLQFGQEI